MASKMRDRLLTIGLVSIVAGCDPTDESWSAEDLVVRAGRTWGCTDCGYGNSPFVGHYSIAEVVTASLLDGASSVPPGLELIGILSPKDQFFEAIVQDDQFFAVVDKKRIGGKDLIHWRLVLESSEKPYHTLLVRIDNFEFHPDWAKGYDIPTYALTYDVNQYGVAPTSDKAELVESRTFDPTVPTLPTIPTIPGIPTIDIPGVPTIDIPGVPTPEIPDDEQIPDFPDEDNPDDDATHVNVCDEYDPNDTSVVLIMNERYSDTKKTVKPNARGYVSLACRHHALMKMKFVGHDPNDAYHSDVAQRQATLKMITADYCGTGQSFTQFGQPLVWLDSLGLFSSIPPTTTHEAVWDDKGAICLDTPRYVSPSDVAGVCSIPTCTGYEAGYWETLNPL